MRIEWLLVMILVLPLLGAACGFWFGRRLERVPEYLAIAVTSINLLLAFRLYPVILSQQRINFFTPEITGAGIHLQLDPLRYPFVLLTALIWWIVSLYTPAYPIGSAHRNRYSLFSMLTYWSTLGVFLSANFLNLFAFFEIMSLTAYPMIIHDQQEESQDAAQSYIVLAVAGGLALLMGLLLLGYYVDTLEIELLHSQLFYIGPVKYVILSLILIGFGVKAGLVPLHIWLPKAHAAAPAPGSAILSGVLLKTGIFGIFLTLVVIFPQEVEVSAILTALGFVTLLTGGILALVQTQVKRLLAYSSMSQMGYLLIGIGLVGLLHDHQAIAVYSVLFHTMNHMLFKVLLFLGAGLFYLNWHALDLNQIGGRGTSLWLQKLLFLAGVLAITGVPGLSGFLSKNLLHHALTEAAHYRGSAWLAASEWAFVLGSALTTAYMLKLYVAVFVEKQPAVPSGRIEGHEPASAPRTPVLMVLPMLVIILCLIGIGIYPQPVVSLLTQALEMLGIHSLELQFMTLGNYTATAISLGLGILIYWLVVRRLLRVQTGASWAFRHPLKGRISLERQLYAPVGQWLYRVLTVVFEKADITLTRPAQQLTTTYQRLLGCMVGRRAGDAGQITVADWLSRRFSQVNSLEGTLYAFGLVLVVVLALMVR